MKRTKFGALRILILPTIVYVFFLALNFERFSNPNCLYTIFIQSIIPTISGYALAFGYISGIFDFSIGSRMILAGLIGGIVSAQFGMAGLIVGCIVSSVVISILTAAINWIARIPSLVLTMGITLIFEIVGQKISGQFSFVSIPNEYSFLGGAPHIIVILIIVAILFYIIHNKTRFSYQNRAVGSNETIAQNMGINVQLVKALSFVIGAVFLGIAALLTISQSGSMGSQVSFGSAMMLFKPLMCVMIAVAFESVCDLTLGIFVAQLTINIIFIGLIASGLPDTFQNVTLGIFLLLVMLFSANKKEFTALFIRKKKIVL